MSEIRQGSNLLPRLPAYEVWPYYLILDTSASMGDRKLYPNLHDELPIEILQRYVEEIISFFQCPPEKFAVKLRDYQQEFGQVPHGPTGGSIALDDLTAVQARIHLSIIAFNSKVSVLRKLSPLDSRKAPPRITLSAAGETNYQAVFSRLCDLIVSNANQLREAGNVVQRPAVIFFTDGQPQANGRYQWSENLWGYSHFQWGNPWLDLQELGDKLAPGIVSIGIGEANPTNLRAVATPAHGGLALKARAGAPINVLMLRIMEGIVGSITGTATGGAFRFPDIPEFERLEGALGMVTSWGTKQMPPVPLDRLEKV